MNHKKKGKGSAPVPPGNRSRMGPGAGAPLDPKPEVRPADGEPFQEQDPKRRLGDFTGTGEHSIVQPGGHNDANH